MCVFFYMKWFCLVWESFGVLQVHKHPFNGAATPKSARQMVQFLSKFDREGTVEKIYKFLSKNIEIKRSETIIVLCYKNIKSKFFRLLHF